MDNEKNITDITDVLDIRLRAMSLVMYAIGLYINIFKTILWGLQDLLGALIPYFGLVIICTLGFKARRTTDSSE